MGEERQLFGVERPDVVCMARVEIKLPTSARGKPSAGRPMKIWTGSSDADESLIHLAVCENEVLRRLLKDRRALSSDGSATLQGKLTFFDNSQTISKHDIEVYYVGIEPEESNTRPAEVMQQLFIQYSNAMRDVKSSTDAQLAKISEGFGQIAHAFGTLAQGFSDGMGKISEQTKEISKLTKRLERDRRKLSQALLSVASRPKAEQRRSDTHTLELTLRAISLLRGFNDDKGGGSSSGSGGTIGVN